MGQGHTPGLRLRRAEGDRGNRAQSRQDGRAHHPVGAGSSCRRVRSVYFSSFHVIPWFGLLCKNEFRGRLSRILLVAFVLGWGG